MSNSYPKQKKAFVLWAKAMVEGSTVDKPNYGKSQQRGRKRRKSLNASKRMRRRKNGKKAQD